MNCTVLVLLFSRKSLFPGHFRLVGTQSWTPNLLFLGTKLPMLAWFRHYLWKCGLEFPGNLCQQCHVSWPKLLLESISPSLQMLLGNNALLRETMSVSYPLYNALLRETMSVSYPLYNALLRETMSVSYPLYNALLRETMSISYPLYNALLRETMSVSCPLYNALLRETMSVSYPLYNALLRETMSVSYPLYNALLREQ